MNCENVRPVLSEALDGSLASDAQRHVDVCLRCQAELAHHRRLRRVMLGLSSQVVHPAPSLADAVMARIQLSTNPVLERAERGRRRVAYVAGVVAAVSAGVVGVVVATSRSRKALPIPVA